MQLLEIKSEELKFVFELKKQSSCSVQLVNITDNHVAFKVKTTSPKRYCVRPNTGIVMPNSTYEFTVTMQAPRTATPDLVCRDKFLIQSTIVSAGTSEDDIFSSMFVKQGNKYIEEKKLSVAVMSPPSSPLLSPINVTLKEGPMHGGPNIKDQSRILNGVARVNSKLKDQPLNKVDFLIPQQMVHNDAGESRERKKDGSEPAKVTESNQAEELVLKTVKEVDSREINKVELKPAMVTESNTEELVLKKVKDVKDLKVIEEIKEMKLKLTELELKLDEAQITISKLTEERRLSLQEIQLLRKRFVELSKRGVRREQVEFPLLYVCMVALICIFIGRLLHH